MNKRIREKKVKQFRCPLVGDHVVFPFLEFEGYVSIIELTIPQIKDHIRNHPEEWCLENCGYIVNGRIKKGIRIEIEFDGNEMVIDLYKNRRCVGRERFYCWYEIEIEKSQLN